ncbi:MAG TPA: helicase HerA-like domain-containing protein [Candidatus Saccharimonadales bacterium]|nr:helicase HerA-like domain-containing protein [Candidatus Saccharimonadales bacterium]
MIPSVTPFFNPSTITAPFLASASAAVTHSPIMVLLPIIPYLPSILLAFACICIVLSLGIFVFSLQHSLTKPKILLELVAPYDSRQTAFSTEQVVTTLHSLGLQTSWWQCFLGRKKVYALELVATRNEGIRYCIRIYRDEADIVTKTLRAYIPGIIVTEIAEYLPETQKHIHGIWNSITFRLTKHFTLPLQKQTLLTEHDPIAYITTHMTKLEIQELIVYQILVTPLIKTLHGNTIRELSSITAHLYHGFDITHKIQKRTGMLGLFSHLLHFLISIFIFLLSIPLGMIEAFFRDSHDKTPLTYPIWLYEPAKPKRHHELSPEQQYTHKLVQEKIGQALFEATIRVFLIQQNKEALKNRIKGFITSFSPFTNGSYQALVVKRALPFITYVSWYWKYTYFLFSNRLLALQSSNNVILTVSELSSLFHFPYHGTTETEDMVNTKSDVLPTPLSFKQPVSHFDTIFAKNTYGERETPIGLTMDERRRHVYILGATGTGKTTLLQTMIQEDIEHKKGVAVIDPHGDLIEKLLPLIPKNRIKDVILFDPSDLDFPIGINLLELPKGLHGSELEKEKDLIASSLVSIFLKLYPAQSSRHRMEYILRNATLTALETEKPTLFTIQKLLSDDIYRNSIVKTLTDEVLTLFWDKEFKQLGSYQKADAITPVTNKIGRFLTSPLSKYILGQETSAIDFADIMNNGKIFLCNLSKGKIGEDTSALFGALVTAKIQLTALKRVHIPEKQRKDFYLYIDEFQNFATPSFAEIMSEARKYHLNAILAHQTMAQIDDKDLVKIILANTGTIICFRTGSSFDEDFILPSFRAKLQEGDIANLPSYHFYIKSSAIEPQDVFSGETILSLHKGSNTIKESVITTSRITYGKTGKKTIKKRKKTATKSSQKVKEKQVVHKKKKMH